MTLRQYAVATGASAERRGQERAILAWSTAKLMRAKDIPKLEELIGRPHLDPEERAAEMRAAMRAYRQVAAERGKIRSWKQWLH